MLPGKRDTQQVESETDSRALTHCSSRGNHCWGTVLIPFRIQMNLERTLLYERRTQSTDSRRRKRLKPQRRPGRWRCIGNTANIGYLKAFTLDSDLIHIYVKHLHVWMMAVGWAFKKIWSHIHNCKYSLVHRLCIELLPKKKHYSSL